MGLFGGFKAKFKRSIGSKENQSKDIVPLNFCVKAEFDSQQPPAPVPIGIRSVLRNNKRRRPVIRSATFEETSRALQSKLESTSLSNLSSKPTTSGGFPTDHKYEEPVAFQKIKTKSNSVNKRISPVVNDSNDEYNKTNSLYIPNSMNRIYDDEYEDVTQLDDYKNIVSDNSESALILMTQNSDSSLSSKSKPSIDDYKKKEPKENDLFPTNQTVPVETKDDFKVHFAEHDLRNYTSEDDLTEDELDEDNPSYTRPSVGYSSQAASLFFGTTEEPIITRPRKLMLKSRFQDNDDEVDC